MTLKILFSDRVDALTRFTYQTGTEVLHSCAATLNNEMFVFGGRNQKRQVNIERWDPQLKM